MFPTRRITTSGGDVFRDEYSLEFDGTNDYVDCGSDASLRVSGDLTISCWIKTSTSQGAYLFSRDDGSTRSYYLQQNASSNRLQMRVQDGSGNNQYIRGTTNFADGNWHHVVGVFDAGSTLALYIDGDSESVTSGSTDATGVSSLNTSALNPWIGSNKSDGDYWEGKISEVSIWNTTLSANQVKTLYNGREPFDAQNLAKSNLVGYWRMGDGTERGTGTTIYDMSANANNGTLTNHTGLYSGDVPR